MFFRGLSKPKTLYEAISLAIRELGKQYAYLRLSLSRLNNRERELFDVCESMVRQGNKQRALIYASEVAEVRKLIKIIKNVQLAIERAILRFETLREVEAITQDLKNVVNETEKLTEQLSDIMPEVASELSKMGSVISDVLSTTVLSSTPPVTTFALDTEEVKEILTDALKVVEEEIQSQLPEPPFTIKTPEAPEIHKPVPVAVTVNYDSSPYHSTEMKSKEDFSSLIERWVLGYAKKNEGKIDVDKCASELRILSNDVFRALQSLHSKGKIKIET